MDKLKSAWAAFDGALPRMWKEWLVTALIVVAMYMLFIGGQDRAMILLAKVPLLTLGGILGYHGDRALFPYARPGDMLKAFDAAKQAGPMADERYAAVMSSFNVACLRRAIIVAAAILGAAMAA